ncbi:MAG: AgrD family cyclic lactone autoinducer peptide [Huintestinicola sp.]
MKKELLKVVAKAAEKSAKASAVSTCCGLSYQPKAPKDLKKCVK